MPRVIEISDDGVLVRFETAELTAVKVGDTLALTFEPACLPIYRIPGGLDPVARVMVIHEPTQQQQEIRPPTVRVRRELE